MIGFGIMTTPSASRSSLNAICRKKSQIAIRRDCNRLKVAAMAMQGILSNRDIFDKALQTGKETLSGENISYRAVAKASFAFADYLIAEAQEDRITE